MYVQRLMGAPFARGNSENCDESGEWLLLVSCSLSWDADRRFAAFPVLMLRERFSIFPCVR